MRTLLNLNRNVVIELPSASGKTTEMLIVAIYHTNIANRSLQILFVCSNEHTADYAFKMALDFAKFTDIKIALVSFSREINFDTDAQIVIGTAREIMRQTYRKSVYMGYLTHVYADDADEVLCYKQM